MQGWRDPSFLITKKIGDLARDVEGLINAFLKVLLNILLESFEFQFREGVNVSEGDLCPWHDVKWGGHMDDVGEVD